MNNKLPKIFANKIDKKIKNNKEVYVSAPEPKEQLETNNKKEPPKQNKKTINKTIEQKINEIIKSNNYIYKIPVKIQLKDEEIITNIIGKNNKNIITMDNKLIKINEIKNIEIDKKNE